MQTMQLSERQGQPCSCEDLEKECLRPPDLTSFFPICCFLDMLLGQACKVYHYASLSLDDIFEYVPQQNQLCLFTAMMMLAQ